MQIMSLASPFSKVMNSLQKKTYSNCVLIGWTIKQIRNSYTNTPHWFHRDSSAAGSNLHCCCCFLFVLLPPRRTWIKFCNQILQGAQKLFPTFSTRINTARQSFNQHTEAHPRRTATGCWSGTLLGWCTTPQTPQCCSTWSCKKIEFCSRDIWNLFKLQLVITNVKNPFALTQTAEVLPFHMWCDIAAKVYLAGSCVHGSCFT